MVEFPRRLRTALIAVLLLSGSTPAVAWAARYPPPVSIVNRLTDKCLEIDHGWGSGAMALQWECHRGPHQVWRIHDLGNTYVRLVVEHSGLCLQAGSLGEVVRTYPCDIAETHQQWRQVDRGWLGYKFQNRYTGWWLEVQEASHDPGKPVVTWTEHAGLHQVWPVLQL
ncbi:RICIN domain-containing protein [Saccharothrix syringae]|uniref:RICIN domain-containing protein n=1 Tax=Saccharothrix syringae TaxID=103733 RepID=UPI0014777482|nr:RICIN domain-containing protein [Saccharothrix syringae]